MKKGLWSPNGVTTGIFFVLLGRISEISHAKYMLIVNSDCMVMAVTTLMSKHSLMARSGLSISKQRQLGGKERRTSLKQVPLAALDQVRPQIFRVLTLYLTR